MYLGFIDTISTILSGIFHAKELLFHPSFLLLGFANGLTIIALIVFLRKPSALFGFLILYCFIVGAVSSIPFVGQDNFLNELSIRYGFVAVPSLLFFFGKTLDELEREKNGVEINPNNSAIRQKT